MFSFTRRSLRLSMFGVVTALLIAIAGFLSSPAHASVLHDLVVNSDPAGPATEPDRVERIASHADQASQGDQAPQAAYPLRTLYSYGFYPARKGAVHFIFNDTDVHANSIVAASITEIDANYNPWFGAAQMNVANVTASEGKVDMWVNIGWNSPLPTRVSFEIMQP